MKFFALAAILATTTAQDEEADAPAGIAKGGDCSKED